MQREHTGLLKCNQRNSKYSRFQVQYFRIADCFSLPEQGNSFHRRMTIKGMLSITLADKLLMQRLRIGLKFLKFLKVIP